MIEPLSVITSILPVASRLFSKQFLQELVQAKKEQRSEKIEELVSALKQITRMQRTVVSVVLSLLSIEDTIARALSELNIIMDPRAASFRDRKETSLRLLENVRELTKRDLTEQIEEFLNMSEFAETSESSGESVSQFADTYREVMGRVKNTVDVLEGEIALADERCEPEPLFYFVTVNLTKLSYMTKELIRETLLYFEQVLRKIEEGVM